MKKKMAIAGKRYNMKVSLRLDFSLFPCISEQSSFLQIGGSLSSGIGVQQTTQCLC
ncbi:uncharacterized protein METZ01_LOCUS432404, partial [marine metagenome]